MLHLFLPKFNRRFAKSALKTEPAWREADPKWLEHALCFKYRRVVAKDNTVRFEGAVFQIPKRSPHLSYAGKKVHVHVMLDGSVEFFYTSERMARFDSKTTHRIGLYRTNGSREVSHYGPETTTSMVPYGLSP